MAAYFVLQRNCYKLYKIKVSEEQNRTGQGRAGSDRTGPGRARDGRAGLVMVLCSQYWRMIIEMNIVFRSINAYFVHHGNYFSFINTNFIAVLYYNYYYYSITSYLAYSAVFTHYSLLVVIVVVVGT